MVLDKDVRQQAYKSIRESLDVVNIVKELDNVRLLVQILFRDHHRLLVPLISATQVYKRPSQSMPETALNEVNQNIDGKTIDFNKSKILSIIKDD